MSSLSFFFFLEPGSSKNQWKTKKWRKNKQTSKKECQKQKSWCQRLQDPGGYQDDSSMTAEMNQRCTEERLAETQTGKENRRVTGFGSRGVCCLSGRLWLVGGLCPLRCCLETHHAQICQIFASEKRYGIFLQKGKQEDVKSY